MRLLSLLALCAFKVLFASQTESAENDKTSSANLSEPAAITSSNSINEGSSASVESSSSSSDPLDKWVKIYKERESKTGSTKLNRLLEIDPLPPKTSTRLVGVCLKYSEDLAHVPKNNPAALNTMKLKFWEEIKPLALSLIHPLCIKVMADCADVLSAEKLVELIDDSAQILFAANHDLITRVPDYSLFTPSRVESFFEAPVGTGLNLAKVPNVLRTLKTESLKKLMEMLVWDIEFFEMVTLVEARGGIEALIKEFEGNLNFMNMMARFPSLTQQQQQQQQQVSDSDFSNLERLFNALESGSYDKKEMFVSLIHLIIVQECLLYNNLSILNNKEITDETYKNLIQGLVDKIFMDKIRLKEILKGSEDFSSLYVFSTTPMSSIVRCSTLHEYENELPENLIKFLENWKKLIKSNLGAGTFFGTSSIARTLFDLVILNYSDDEKAVDVAIEFYERNRLRILHSESVFALKRAWPSNEKVVELEQHFFTLSIDHAVSRPLRLFKELCKEASSYYSAFNDTRFIDDLYRESIGAWVSYQLRLQATGTLLKQYDQSLVANTILPLLLEDEVTSDLIQEHGNIFLNTEVIGILLQDEIGQGLLKTYPRLLHGLSDYKSFNGKNFQSLSIDFSKIRRGLSTIPTIQLVNFLKSKKGLVDDPIGLLAAVPLSAWNVKDFFKYFSMYFRPSLVIEDFRYSEFIVSVFIEPQFSTTDSKALLWSIVKFAINTELLYQEIKISEGSSDLKSEVYKRLFIAEAFYRPILADILKNAADSTPETLVVIKTLLTIPLSRDRLNTLVTATSVDFSKMFPSFSLKSAQANYTKSLKNFKLIINKFGETEEIKLFWMYLLAICSRDVEEINRMMNDDRIPIYYRVLGKRIVS